MVENMDPTPGIPYTLEWTNGPKIALSPEGVPKFGVAEDDVRMIVFHLFK